MTSTARSLRRTGLALALAGFLVATLASAPVATAALPPSQLLIQGPGAQYTDGSAAILVAPAGGTATYSLKIINTGPAGSFKLFSAADNYQPQYGSFRLVYGTPAIDITTPATSSAGWATPVIASGGTLTVTLSTTLGRRLVGHNDYAVKSTLLSPTGSSVSTKWATTVPEANAVGKDSFTVKARAAGTTAWAGDDDNTASPTMTEPLTRNRVRGVYTADWSTAVFTVRVENDGYFPSKMGLIIDGPAAFCGYYDWTVFDGTTDITSAISGFTFSTPVLSPGGYRDYTVRATYTGPIYPTSNCLSGDGFAETYSGTGTDLGTSHGVNMEVPLAANQY